MRSLLAVLASLAACAHARPPQPPQALLESCSPGVRPPPAPKPPRTPVVLAQWSIQIQLAREATERARADCADRHAELAAWISRQQH